MRLPLHRLGLRRTLAATRCRWNRGTPQSEGVRSDWEYPFSAAGMNVTFMLVDVLGLRSAAAGRDGASGAPKHNKTTLRALLEIERESDDILVAFNEVYCVAFEMLDAQWLEQRASYLQFNGAPGPSRRGAPRARLRGARQVAQRS